MRCEKRLEWFGGIWLEGNEGWDCGGGRGSPGGLDSPGMELRMSKTCERLRSG